MNTLSHLKTKLPEKVYKFLRNNYNVIMRADGTSAIWANIYLEVDAEGNTTEIFPSPLNGMTVLERYLRDTNPNDYSAGVAAAFYEAIIEKSIAAGEFIPKENIEHETGNTTKD